MYDRESFVAGRIYQRVVEERNACRFPIHLSHGVDDKVDGIGVVRILTSLLPNIKISIERLNHGSEITIESKGVMW